MILKILFGMAVGGLLLTILALLCLRAIAWMFGTLGDAIVSLVDSDHDPEESDSKGTRPKK